MSVKPPITWFGGKARLATRIVKHFVRHQTYCEPFGGSAAVLLEKEPSNVEVYNDIDGDLVNLFQVLRDPILCDRLRTEAESTLYARAEFELAKEPTTEPVERARRFLVRQRQSHGGLGKRWSYCIKDSAVGMSSVVRRWQLGLERLPLVHKRLKAVQIEQDDWRAVMQRFDGPHTLFYLDPPYVPNTRVNGGYCHELNQDDHYQLVEHLLMSVKGMVVLSGYAHEVYKPLEEAGWSREDYSMPAYTSSRRERRIECLWLSPLVAAISSDLPAHISPVENMRQGAYQTHQIRVESTEAKLVNVIRDMKKSGERITISSVAAAANMSREHLGRKYRHLF
jgi:DNA adenine methylase